ncbi:inosine/uridine-preferring nucleoside hydrolase [Mytilinidion resinicola]|uniref:Inosine/uridine-preferring nucleoside hydrolase n=1 Tax=Mytilinidion resinicola TaxID=574789 RepID=A0A6A6YAV9_9PEZI|nr:inosine/uridine-preferring nucleoside hydrolase [Mytilinidion resinicola]KAF2805840.1 inosine/uridine-preferring nucleoside hydrolase [Mytilinidion resinicola]
MLSRLVRAVAIGALLPFRVVDAAKTKKLIIDTDIFSGVDDTTALLLAATLPHAEILAVNVNTASSYSALAVSAIIGHYGYPEVPIGLPRPFTDEPFFDNFGFIRGEYCSKVGYHYSNGSLPWGTANNAWDPVALYRKTLAEQEDQSVTVVSIGFFQNLAGLLNSTSDKYSPLSGPDLVKAKVAELVVMGGQYPSGAEFNFFGGTPLNTAQVVNTWPTAITFSGDNVNVQEGARLTREAPSTDPVAAAYKWSIGYNTNWQTWDPFAVLYAINGLDKLFEAQGKGGHNHVFPNGSNAWVYDNTKKNQQWLKFKVSNVTAANELETLCLQGVKKWA